MFYSKLYLEVMGIYKKVSIIDEDMSSQKKNELQINRDCKMQEEFKTIAIYIGPNKGGIRRNGMKEWI